MKFVWLYGSNPRKVFEFGTQFGKLGYILADGWEDAWQEMLSYALTVDGPCDHGGECTDAQRAANYFNMGTPEDIAAGTCDCEYTEDGHWVWIADAWWVALEELTLVEFCDQMEEAINDREERLEAWRR